MKRFFFTVLSLLIWGVPLASQATQVNVCETLYIHINEKYGDGIHLDDVKFHPQLHLHVYEDFEKHSQAAQYIYIFLEEFAGKKQCVRNMKFVTQKFGSDMAFEGRLRKTDYELLQAGKISRPEWERRLEITKKATLAAIKKGLKAARQAKDGEKVNEWATQWLQVKPKASVPRIVKANMLLEEGAYFPAIQLYEELLKEDPKNEIVLFNHAFALSGSGQYDQAIEIWQGLIAQQSELKFQLVTTASLHLQLAEAHFKNNQLEKAEETLAQIKTVSFARELLWSNVYRAKKEFEKSQLKLENLLKKGQDRDLVLHNLILVELDQQQKEKAVAHYHELQQVNPELAKELSFLKVWQQKVSSQN